MTEKIIYDALNAFLGSDNPSEFFESLRSGNENNKYLSKFFPELERLIGCEQDPVHHPEGDVWHHTMMVIDAAAKRKRKASNAEFFMLAALCHDFGKPDTTVNENGHIHAYGHEKAGVPLAKNFLKRIGATEDAIEYVTEMVQHHMDLHFCFINKSKVKTTNHKFDSVKYPFDLIQLSIADISGKDNTESDEEEIFLYNRYYLYEARSMEPMINEDDLRFLGFDSESPEFKEIIASARKMHFSGVEKVSVLKDIIAKNKNVVDKEKAQVLLDKFKS